MRRVTPAELVSIHAPRVGRDRRSGAARSLCRRFNPRAPCGARLALRLILTIKQMFQSTRPVWGATMQSSSCRDRHAVSIHAPRVGRDKASDYRASRTACFNPRAPCGARPTTPAGPLICASFQSTRPVWGATFGLARATHAVDVSIHAPRVGRDCSKPTNFQTDKFQSTRPVWGATEYITE